ncbi:TPA: hypothetical protein ACIFB9_001956 [Acinetobacter baumannii]|uniref:Uncharacterized protein n=3 Tax=Acinetobacter baumannii TaxID=470 RepID=A0A265A9G5_ACIBA|nr:hypothetical protein [Acinetobacter baumannii]EHU1919696.1 hypothetical protein [Acinetobacter baumannii]KAB1098950.1 hypothetical protein F6W73_14935 [Acinetobacter baumannii]MBC6819115.1 hypothetical protein [Acinetobacter baumannii]MBQ4928601.1 hypothetical protein [Acinetobacter baumannii]MCZ3076244.1 hypothetical protein [Acinetobacter baumannii]
MSFLVSSIGGNPTLCVMHQNTTNICTKTQYCTKLDHDIIDVYIRIFDQKILRTILERFNYA